VASRWRSTRRSHARSSSIRPRPAAAEASDRPARRTAADRGHDESSGEDLHADFVASRGEHCLRVGEE
jgi:hypothetical protein